MTVSFSTPTAMPLPPLARAAFGVATTLLQWELRRMSRRRLADLDPHLLDDIGLTAEAARIEAIRPFWR
ncbi:DUF1127 domain-containing protein [Falsirhodobacter algicola]|uniref:DUF1127 domain-containing protein n=1 Tax=Falsirhodobacter algicola TaxID=2692330 RepID=A0A8J8MRJ2_9RHOB|nr:DUF1127 domain-containing protein [Falsirhodobacter algicola]QUS35061.1 DUF1127 domain-containing protein [Falsirhodobacter algicola]